MKLLRRLLATWFTPVYSPRRRQLDELDERQQRLLNEARERVRRTLL